MDQSIRLLLVDDHSLFRESLSRLLQAERDFVVVRSCVSIAEAIACLEQEAVDIVLLDYDLGEEQASVFFREAKTRGFRSRVLMVTAGMDDAEILEALDGGVSGVFLKHSPPSHLIEAIHRISSGETWLDPKVVRTVVAAATDRSEQERNSQPLTPRERVVLKAVFEGYTNKEIAARTGNTEDSVKWLMRQLFNKTGVRTRSQLVRIALERRWLIDDAS